MNKERFLELCDSSYSHIPVYEEFVADLISPLYIFSNFYDQSNCFLFESAKVRNKRTLFNNDTSFIPQI